ncbi:BppU family phage baseplate upper protein [Tetragenococcus halophilus]|uniref:BppU family phage baseplate upper protein n=1 Tax=Tetragenococcus halophilus TaxID=51669 RepID=A0AB35HQ74_TETHA|nr:BppU family phage baseplate upper protein [Tetragenococcus halophilus]MCO8298414.1 BppU family phage baseplate upper protein [Tetragenococcus halophilus]
MPILKKGEIEAKATAYGTEVKSTGYVFYSYDKKASALFFQFRNQNGETTDIANAKIRLLLIKNDDEDKEFIPNQEDFEIISKPGGKAKFVLPEMLLAYQGKVTGYIYLDFEDGSQTDDGQFTFRIKHSMITHVLPEAGDKYVQDFEDVKERVEQAGDSATKDIEKAKDDAKSQIGDYVGEVESAKSDMQESVDQVNKDYEDWKAEQEEQQTTFESDTNKTINGINTKVEKAQTKISDLEEWVPNADDLATKQYVDESVEGFNETNEKLNVRSVKLNVPSDFPTLDSAFHEIESNIYATRASVYVNIEAGHQISEGVVLKSRDYRRVTIQSEDDIVEVADGFTGDLLKGSDCHFPIFNLLVDMKSLGSFGLGLYSNANATVKAGCGVINAGDDGVFVNRLSQLYAHEANFSGATRCGMFVDHANAVYARYVNLDNCEVGVRATKGSVVEVANASIQNCRNAILATEGGKVIGITDPSEPDRHLNVSGASGNAIDLTNGAEFVADKVVIENCGTGIVARASSKVVCSGTGIVNCGEAMKLSKQSTAYMGGFYMNSITDTAITVYEGAFLQAESSECHVDGVAFTIKNGSRVNLDDSDLTNCGTPVKCSYGSHANCYNVDATGHTASYGFYVYTGSTINAVEALGDLRVTANTLTSDGYIIQ